MDELKKPEPLPTDAVVQIEGQTLKLSDTKSGMVVKSVGGAELDQIKFEATVLGDGFEKLLENDFNTVANQVYRDLLQSLRNNLTKAVLSSLGFSSSYSGEWAVDNCNRRQSEMSDLLAENVKRAFRENVEVVFQEEKEKLFKGVHAAIRKEFRQCVQAEINRGIRTAAQEAATSFLKSLVEKEMNAFTPQATELAKKALFGKPEALNKKIPQHYATNSPNFKFTTKDVKE